MYLFSIGSKSEIKYKALSNALMRLGVDFTVIRHDVPSGVPTQPVGDWETSQGARNRAKHAAALAPGSWGIGIENGLMRQGDKWLDMAAAVLVSPEGEQTVIWSEAVEFPADIVALAESRGFDRTTAGAVIAELRGGSPQDPHALLSDGARTRTDILADTVEKLLRHVWNAPKKEETMKTSHRIEIGGVVRELPVREVAPNVRVALFNILGDWELTEAAGKALAAELPSAVDALVMPDGKATALLHVLGRESGLPTYVARKEKKPYMAEPVKSFSYKSITTDRQQMLCLGAEDAEALAGQRVIIVDDVVSSGGTIVAMTSLMQEIGAEVLGVAAIFTEGDRRDEVISLGHLPLF